MFRHFVGGLEVYLGGVLPALSRFGWEIQLWHDHDPPENAELLPISMPTHSLARLGLQEAHQRMLAWQPEVIFDNGVENTDWEGSFQNIAPVVHFAHAYTGTCISGSKSWRFPVHRPCARPLGAACLLHYFPHRCGGLSPATMLRQYRVQARRLRNMRGFSSIVTASEHMRREFLNHGFPHDRVVRVGLYLPDHGKGIRANRPAVVHDPARILYCGRMVPPKGGPHLIDAVDLAARRLGRKVCLTLVGDGPDRSSWEMRALLHQSNNQLVQYQFVDWLSRERLQEYYASHDLVAVPSVWPEPFGMVCVEASQYGAPVVAFDVGGITDSVWDGVNGHLAGAPLTADSLAHAIVRCLEDPLHYAKLCLGARQQADQPHVEEHLERLTKVFASVRRLAG